MPVLPPRDGFLRIADPFTPYPTITSWFQALFTSLLGVLFSFQSPYYCAIGLKTYLVLEVDASQLPVRFPTHGTQDTGQTPWITPTWLSHSMALRSRRLRFLQVGFYCPVPTTPHFHALIEHGFGLNCAAFTRRYSRHPNWFLLLPLLRCFNSGRSPSLTGVTREASGSPIRRSPDLRLPAPPRGLSQLGTSFISA